MQQVIGLSTITPQSVQYFQDAANGIKKISPSQAIWSPASKTGNHIQFPIYKFFSMSEPKNWRVELEFVRIKCLAMYMQKNKINPTSKSSIGYIAAAGFFFEEIRRISQEAQDFETAKGHYQCLVAYLAAA